MASVITATFFRQTLIPIKNYYKYYSTSEAKRFKPVSSTEDNFEEALEKRPRQEDYKAKNFKLTSRSSFYTKNFFMPVRFHPGPSMHRPACPDFTKTRLHSLPITKSLENPVTCESPWSLFFCGCRFYSTPCFCKEVGIWETHDDNEVKLYSKSHFNDIEIALRKAT